MQTVTEVKKTVKFGIDGLSPEDAANISTRLLATYSTKTRTAHQEALSIIDEWKPDD